jgi:1-acyl-sn-glycerol-3-phosphate acyltransferase
VGWITRLLFNVRREGFAKIPKRGPVILVSNHVSNLDPVLVVASAPRPVYHLAKHTLFKGWFRRTFFETLGGQVPVDRVAGGNEAAILAGVRILEQGLALGIYPEGARTRDGKLKKGRRGVARLALLSGAPVYPVAIVGAYEAWPPGQRLPRLFRRTRLIVGAPRQYAVDPKLASDEGFTRRVTDQIMADLALLTRQSYDPQKAEYASPDVFDGSAKRLREGGS